MEILPNPVQPGDLITSDFINSVLARLADIEGRVELLEGADPGDAVVVTQLIPSGSLVDPIRVGQTLQIIGRNFGFSLGGHRVLFDSLSVSAFGLGSSDTQLIVTVPTALNIPQGGRSVVLTVTNGVTTDSRTITVHPVAITLSGDVDVLWRDDVEPNPNPNPIPRPDPGTVIALFSYRLRSRASTLASFEIIPGISVSAWQPSLQVLNEDGDVVGDRRFELNPDEEVNFTIRATMTSQPGVTAFDLNVVAAAGNVTGGLLRNFVFDEAVEEGDDQIELAVTDATVFNLATGSPDPAGGSFDVATNTISVFEGFRLDLSFAATFLTAAIYDVTVETGPGTTNWDLRVRSPNTGIYDQTGANVPVNETPRFSAEPEPGASASGQVTFRIQRQGEERSQARTYNLVLQA